MVVHGRYLRQPDKGSYVRPAVPSGEAVSVSETGFDAGGLLDWSVTRVAAGRLSRQDVKDRALLMISGETIARLKADAASLPLRQPLEQSSLRGGNFAENIFVSAAAGADSPCPDSLCVGDVLAVVAPRGSKRRCASSAAAESPTLRLQVSSPRRPCSKIDARFGRTWNGGGVRALCARTGLSGWFVRVLAPGELRDGDGLGATRLPSACGRRLFTVAVCVSRRRAARRRTAAPAVEPRPRLSAALRHGGRLRPARRLRAAHDARAGEPSSTWRQRERKVR